MVVEWGSTEQDSKKEAAKEKDGIDSKMDYWKARCTEKKAVERKEWNWKVEVWGTDQWRKWESGGQLE